MQPAPTTTFAYNLANDMLSESYAGGTLGGFSVTNGYDAFLRRTNVASLKSSLLNQAICTYDNASRLASVSDGTDTASYTCVANSSLVGQITFKRSGATEMTTTKQFDNLNRLTSIASSPSNSFAYQCNAANQRVRTTLADGSYWLYQYDALGQVTGGVKYWSDGTVVAGQQFKYIFDTIGNRTQTKAGGDQSGGNLRVANYTNNTLNQITSRDIPSDVDVLGDALATNTVTVNGQTPYRKGEYFRDQFGVTNASAADWQSITVASSGQNTITGNAFVAREPETFTYDQDGNLTQDGRWKYTWDGENRLTSMTSLSGGPSGSLLQLNFAYDYMGRRIQKMVSTNNGSYIGQYTNHYGRAY